MKKNVLTNIIYDRILWNCIQILLKLKCLINIGTLYYIYKFKPGLEFEKKKMFVLCYFE